MVKPLFVLKKGLITLAIVCFLSPIFSLVASTPTQDLWNQSLEQLKNNLPAQACENLKAWVTLQSPQNIKSPEAMFNLSLCSWKLNEPANSVLYLLESLKIRKSPSKIWANIKLLQNFQREIGIRENLASKPSFIIRMLLPIEVSLVLALCGAWLLFLNFIFRKKLANYVWFIYTSISTCWLLSLFVFSLQNILGPIGVISGTEEKPVFVFDKLGKPEELTRLPAGTLLELGQSKQNFSQIIQPIGGWIKTDSIQTQLSTDQ